MIKLDSTICTDFESASSREWLETNGIGGFSSSTISGTNTRRYHGLLTAATAPPLGRLVLLSKFDETLTIDAAIALNFLLINIPNKVYPAGFQYLKYFRLELRFQSGLLKLKESKSKKRFLWLTEKIRLFLNTK